MVLYGLLSNLFTSIGKLGKLDEISLRYLLKLIDPRSENIPKKLQSRTYVGQHGVNRKPA